jgi:hypothetical protein
MRRLWIVAVPVLVAMAVGARAAPAKAGGSAFDFHRRWFAPGQLAEGKTQFSDWVGAPGRVAQGPYFAYLVRGDRFIEPPHLPRNAIRLGQVKMTHVEGTIWEASISFVVPHVRPGGFMVSLCNDRCRNTSVGDLVGAWISIATSAEQAKMRNLEDRIVARLEERNAELTDALWAQLEELRGAVDRARPPSITVGTEMRLAPLEDQVKVLAAQVRDLRERSDQGPLAWLWLLGWVVAAGISVLWRRTAVRRRRSAKATPASDEVTWMEMTPAVAPPDVTGGSARAADVLVSR